METPANESVVRPASFSLVLLQPQGSGEDGEPRLHLHSPRQRPTAPWGGDATSGRWTAIVSHLEWRPEVGVLVKYFHLQVHGGYNFLGVSIYLSIYLLGVSIF